MPDGTFDGLISSNESVNSSKLFDSGLRYSLQDNQGMGLYVPMVNPDFWQKAGPKLQETMRKLWADNIATYRANTAKQQQSGRGGLYVDHRLLAHGHCSATAAVTASRKPTPVPAVR